MIIFDTSILYGLHRRNPKFDLLRAVKRSGLELGIPWMVYEELLAHQVLAYTEAFNKATAAVDALRRKSPWRSGSRQPPNEIEQARNYWSNQYEELFEILATSGEVARQALAREAHCQKPANVAPESKGGARDAAIWLSVVDYMKASPGEGVVFVCGNTSDFGDGTSYNQPMADDLRGVESQLIHLTSFEEFVERFTEPIAINDQHVKSVLTRLMEETPNPIEAAAENLLQEQHEQGYMGTEIDTQPPVISYQPFRWNAWFLPPGAVMRRIEKASGHKIGGEEWYTATVEWILAGFAQSSPILQLNSIACQWRIKMLFSTRENETPSIIEYERPTALPPSERAEWEPLVTRAMNSASAVMNEPGAMLSALPQHIQRIRGDLREVTYT